MAIDGVSSVDTTTGEIATEAYITPRVDFLLLLTCMCAVALAGAAVIIP